MIPQKPKLTPRSALLFEAALFQQWQRPSTRTPDEIRDQFGCTETPYFQALNAAIDDPGLIAEFPTQTRALRERRASRMRQRK